MKGRSGAVIFPALKDKFITTTTHHTCMGARLSVYAWSWMLNGILGKGSDASCTFLQVPEYCMLAHRNHWHKIPDPQNFMGPVST